MSLPSEPWKPTRDKVAAHLFKTHARAHAGACTVAKQHVRDQFARPATAKFQDCYDLAVEVLDLNWTVTVVVDGQNGSGAPLRTRYLVPDWQT